MTKALPFFFTLLLTATGSMSVAQSPIHHWPLDAINGPTASDAAGSTDGMLVNGPIWQPNGGKHTGALDLDGLDDRVDLGPIDLFSGTGITLTAWVKADNAPVHEQFIVAKTSAVAPNDHSWTLSIVNATALQFRLKTAGVTKTLTTPGGVIFPGSWYHIAGTYDGTEMRLYMSGTLMAFTSCTGAIGYEPNSFASIGDLSSGVQESFGGLVDDVRIYDSGLNASQVHDLVLGSVATTIASVSQSNSSAQDASWSVYDATGRAVMGPTQLEELTGRYFNLLPGQYILLSADGLSTMRAMVHGEQLLLEKR